MPHLKYRTLRQQVVNMLKDAIISGQLKPGEKLVEVDLAAKWGLSRSPVREAFRELEKDGLLVSVANKGTMVTQFNADDVVQIYSIRAVLEQLGIRWATQKITQSDVERFKQVLRRMQAIFSLPDEQRALQVINLDMEFHQLVVDTARAERLKRILQPLYVHIQVIMGMSGRPYSQRGAEEISQEHEELCQLMFGGKAEEAAELMGRHVLRSAERILADFVS